MKNFANMVKKAITKLSLSTLFLLGFTSCVQYPIIVLKKYKNYVGKEDTLIFVRKKFDYTVIRNRSCPEEPCECECYRSLYAKKRWGLAYDARHCEDWGQKFNYYVIMIDRWGRKIEEGDYNHPCEGTFIGRYKAYYKNGQVFVIGQFNIRSKRIGEWFFYNRDGKLENKMFYQQCN